MEEEARFELRFEEGMDLYDPRYMAWLECNHPEGVPADRYSLIPAPSHSQDGHETPSLLPHFSVDPADTLQFSDETTPSPTVSIPLRNDLSGPLRPSEAMLSPVVSTTHSPVVSTSLRSEPMPSPVVSTPLNKNRLGSSRSSGTTPSPVVSPPGSSGSTA